MRTRGSIAVPYPPRQQLAREQRHARNNPNSACCHLAGKRPSRGVDGPRGPGVAFWEMSRGPHSPVWPDAEEMIGEADKVCTRFTWTGTQRGLFVGVPATGRRVTVRGVVIDRLHSGKMADSRILMNTLDMMQQLGVVPQAERTP
jgi:hypothetical protein